MKKVLTIVPYPYLPFFSGGQKLIAHFTAYLGDQCMLHVAGTNNNDQALVHNYHFHGVLRNSLLRYIDIFAFFRLKKIIREQQIETVIVEHPYLGWLGWMLQKACNIKLVVHTHNVEYERFRSVGKSWWPLLKWYEKLVLRRADLVFCISTEDQQWMIDKLGLQASTCIVVPYGIIHEHVPLDKTVSKKQVAGMHQLNPHATLLFFNGLLDYTPNTIALRSIMNNINPLLKHSGLTYNILIAGKRLPAVFHDLKQWNSEHIFYVGFVEDIDLYTKAADILLNPVDSGGGVKTKMIEALGLNTTVVSTETGAAGVDKTVCGEKLKIVKNGDWEEFAHQIITSSAISSTTPASFYEKYTWKSIIRHCVQYL